jgi:hypothetical protein
MKALGARGDELGGPPKEVCHRDLLTLRFVSMDPSRLRIATVFHSVDL